MTYKVFKFSKDQGNRAKVIIYTTTHCPYCRLAKQFLQQLGVPFIEKNVELSEWAAQELYMKSGQLGVPVLDINGKIIIGFNPPAIKRALGLD